MGAATPNPRTCRVLTPLGRPVDSRIYPPLKRAPGSATRPPAARIPPTGLGKISSSARWVSAIGFSISRKGNFRARDEGASYCPSGYLLINQALLDARHEKPDGAIGVGRPPV